MKFWEFIRKALSEDNGNPSAMRLMVFYAFIIWVTIIAVALFVTIFWYRELLVVVLGMILGELPLLLGIKYLQKNKEEKDSSQPSALSSQFSTTLGEGK